jgi:epsilon-lactone hydrolase
MTALLRSLATVLVFCATAYAETPASRVDASGTVTVSGFTLPLPPHMSAEAQAMLKAKLQGGPDFDLNDPAEVAKIRAMLRQGMNPAAAKMAEAFAVDLKEETIGGIHAVVATPKGGVALKNRNRVLINLHGGGFVVGDAANLGMFDSIPVAARGRIKVISLDYRMGPEAQFPAASQDVAAAYKALLKTYKPGKIGIYGCSAGGILSAQAAAWIQQENLPRPGAIGVLCAGADAKWAGDSNYVVAVILGKKPLDPQIGPKIDEKLYYGATDMSTPLMSPVVSPKILAAFPPTLLITGTRSEDLSTAANTHRELVKAGVDAELHVWDGMWHGFIDEANLPEAQEATAVIVKFFDKHLK